MFHEHRSTDSPPAIEPLDTESLDPEPVVTGVLSPRVTLVERDGAVVVHKQHRSAAAAATEARWLASAPSRGIVRLLAHDATSITTEHVPGPTLRTAQLSEGQAAMVVISLTRTLAELHDRDLVHGSVAPEHVIVDGNDAVLCSPSITNPLDEAVIDGQGLGVCMAAISKQWQETGVSPSPMWTRLEQQLHTDTPPSPRRVARTLAPVARQRDEAQRPDPTPGQHSTTGLLGLSLFVTVALAGLWFTGADAEPEPEQIITVDEQRFALGAATDVAVGLDKRCAGQPAAVLLDDGDLIWTFAKAVDGEQGQKAMTVPGATKLEVSVGSDGCPVVVVSGPAGRKDLRWDDR